MNLTLLEQAVLFRVQAAAREAYADGWRASIGSLFQRHRRLKGGACFQWQMRLK